MKNSYTGFLLAWQFFSAIPIKKQYPMNQQTVTWMFSLLPVVGLCIGGMVALFSKLLSFTDITPLFTAVLLVLSMIILTGGLHLDGWVDMSDAYFSYADKEKRVAILDDPRIGAFGAMSLVCLLLLKIGVVYEALMQAQSLTWYFLCIPLLGRLAIQLYFTGTATSKPSGLGAYFKNNVQHRFLYAMIGFYSSVLFILALYFSVWSIVVLVVSVALIVIVFKNWTIRNFGGLSGDLMGALCEGTEVVLWLIVLFFI